MIEQFVQWPGWTVVEKVGLIAGLVFTAFEVRRNTKAQHAETNLKFTLAHRELWKDIGSNPTLKDMLDPKRDMSRLPLSAEERRNLGFLFNHLRATFVADLAGTFNQPAGLKEDMESFFAKPAVRTAWKDSQRFQDPKFIRFVERMANLA